MQESKMFSINNNGHATTVGTKGLGRILRRPEIAKIAGSFDPQEIYVDSDTYMEIIPPLKKDQLKKLSDALIELSWQLDPTEPKATSNVK